MPLLLGRGRPAWSRWTPFVAAGLIVVAGLTPARAGDDAITACLRREASDWLEYLHQQKLDNVGVLKFEVKDGPAEPTLHAGLLNTKLAEEVETALVKSRGADYAMMNVLHNATAEAFRRNPQASYATPADRRQLFANDYPLAWGDSKVKASAFLTGRVSLGATLAGKAEPRKAVLEVKAFDKSGEFLKTWEYEVKTDRVLLADSGKGFKLSRKPLGGKAVAVAPADEADARAVQGGQVDGYPVSLTIRYDGVPQATRQDDSPGKLNCFRIAPPPPGARVSFVVKNEGNKKIGVVLCVNGLNTLYEEPEGCPADMHKWVLEKGQEYVIDGFEREDRQTSLPFKAVPPDGRKIANLPFADCDSIGLITMHVLPEADDGEPAEVLTGKGLRFPPGAHATPADLQKALEDYAKSKSKGLISKDSKAQPDVVGTNPLKNPILKETRVIRYTDPAP